MIRLPVPGDGRGDFHCRAHGGPGRHHRGHGLSAQPPGITTILQLLLLLLLL